MKILFLNNKIESNDAVTLSAVGANYGNLLFYFATMELFKSHEIHHNTCDNPDLIVISTANAICNIDSCINYINYLSDQVSKYSCKKMLLSIGGQHHDLESYKLCETAVKGIHDLFSQMDYINLRGTYTHRLLEYNHINYEYSVFGCPSIFLVPKISFTHKKLTLNSKILFNTPRYNQCNCKFFDGLSRCNEIDHLYQDTKYLSAYNITTVNINGFDDWKNKIKDYDFVIGTRIHGSIMALLCNIPTLLIVIDSRTYELAKILNIPFIHNFNADLKMSNKQDIINIVNQYPFDFDTFNDKLEPLKDNFRGLLNSIEAKINV